MLEIRLIITFLPSNLYCLEVQFLIESIRDLFHKIITFFLILQYEKGIYKYKKDDKFKKWARVLQFAYREDVLNDFNEDRAPQVLLSDDNSRKGLIFYKEFRDLILSKDKVRRAGVSALTNNMLRSEHIPYSLFSSLETMPDISKDI